MEPMFDKLIDDFLLMNRNGLCVMDETTKEILYADSLVERTFGSGLAGRPCFQALFGKERICGNCPALSDTHVGPEYWEMAQGGDSPKMVLVSGALLTQKGRLLRVCQFRDISEYLLLVGDVVDYSGFLCRQASAEWLVDALTGLENRNGFLERKNRDYVRCKSWGVVYFDINNMKAANDELGHDTGDELLRLAASAIAELKSENVHAYRIGGDEFIVIVPDCDEGFMRELMERWKRIYQCLAPLKNGIRCGIAAGMAFGTSNEQMDDVIRRADKRMYADKRRQKIKSQCGNSVTAACVRDTQKGHDQ